MAEAQIKCDICNCTFARQEHLTRHTRSHTREKPYRCLQCSKSFSRLDVLQRHISSHEQSASDLAGASARACRDVTRRTSSALIPYNGNARLPQTTVMPQAPTRLTSEIRHRS
ncbi:hypothetical protein NW754_000162 [Fusarium falciforme]|nr:hypothetical protein NW754_000162 [Fusarium falciforme]